MTKLLPRARRIYPRFLILALAVLSAASCKPAPTATLVLQREWVANAEFVGDVWAQDISRQGGPLETERRPARA